jgi:trigger factor
LPEADDNFAKSYGAENMAALRAGVRADLEKDLAYKQNASIRSQVVKELMSKVSIKELPESFVEEETRQIVFDIVAENRRRGISKEIIEKEKDNIHSAALASARERVKAAFVFKKIAQKEKIEVSSEDLINGMAFLASQANMELKAFIKEVQQRDGSLEKISESILTQKVIDFLAKNAKVEDVPPGTLNQDAAPALTTPE